MRASMSRFEITEGQHIHPDFEDPEVVVSFRGPDVELLLENRAELLLALEHLTMEVLAIPAEDHSKVCFDANDYRVLRIEELRLSAMTAAEKVKKTLTPFHFNPMSSRERRIIHLSLRGETGDSQRKHRHRSLPPGRDPPDRHASAGTDSAAASTA